MKIIFLLPHFKMSGGVRVILSYADELAKIGHDIEVVAEAGKKIRYSRLFSRFKHPYLSKNSQVKLRYVKDFGQIKTADVFIGDSWGVAEKLFSLNVGGKKLHTIQHDERLYHGDKNIIEKVYKLPLKKIVVSSWLKEIMKKDFNQNVFLLLNSFSREIFYPVNKERRNKPINILVLYHNFEWKGTREGVEIVQALKNKHSNIRLILFGTRQKHIEYSCDEYYYDLPQEKLAWLYSRADIFLCPSWDEGFGLPSMEAMACGCALVTYDNGGSRDFAFDGKTAMVAKRKDKKDLENKLELLVRDREKREKIAEGGCDYVSKMPTWQEQAKRLEEIILKL